MIINLLQCRPMFKLQFSASPSSLACEFFQHIFRLSLMHVIKLASFQRMINFSICASSLYYNPLLVQAVQLVHFVWHILKLSLTHAIELASFQRMINLIICANSSPGSFFQHIFKLSLMHVIELVTFAAHDKLICMRKQLPVLVHFSAHF